jgi:hypothetical protein
MTVTLARHFLQALPLALILLGGLLLDAGLVV